VKIRRSAFAGILVAALLGPGLTACGANGSEPAATESTAPAIPADPKQALLDSIREISKGNFRFTLTADGVTGEGMVHLPSHSARMTVKSDDSDSTFTMDLIYIESDSWVRLDMPELAELAGKSSLASGKYLHLDRSKIQNDDLKFDFNDVDPAGSELLVKAIVDVRKTDEGVYTGTLDLSKATDADLVDEETVKALGVQATKLPFTANVDAQGRLTTLSIQVPAAGDTKAHELKINYLDYGAATPVEKPAPSETEEAPAETYEMFND
jgi:hypothetical protein